MTVGDVRKEKALAWGRKFAKAFAIEAAARTKKLQEDAILAMYPQIGYVQTAKGRTFYAFTNGYGTDPFKSTDITDVAQAVDKMVGGEFPL